MLLRRILTITIGCIAFGHLCLAQTLSSEQALLSKQLASFLQGEGLAPETSVEGVILFEYDDCNMVLRIDPQEQDPMFVTLAAIFELPKEYSPKIVSLAANELNGYKGVKVLAYKDSFSVQSDMFLRNASAFTEVFQTMIYQIQAAVASFADAYSEAYSDNTQAGKVGREKGNLTISSTSGNNSKPSNRNTTEGIYYNPKVGGHLSTSAKIKRVAITDEYTCVELSTNSTSSEGVAEWCNINGNTYIINEDKPFDKLKLVRASGIKLAPEKTYYGGPNKTVSFKLYFPPIPKDTKSISLIEPDSSWCFYGITLHK